jgi:geranylgeranyl reductase family protein
MDRADVIVVGGGPAGSACAWKLRQSGLDVVVVDRARFPRDKVCGGWITPQVVDDLALDLDDYQSGRTLQPITAFRTGLIGDRRSVDTIYNRTVSYGIRRCEFDDYLLRRSGARLRLGVSLTTLRREGGRWTLNGSIEAPMLVGAGGHFCPIARRLNPTDGRVPLVVAQEAELCIDSAETGAWQTRPEMPELYFNRDLSGYGWCFRKQRYFNVGLGSIKGPPLPAAVSDFLRFLRAVGRTASPASWRWRGHAYLLGDRQHRRAVDDGVLLVGDAAGLAYPQSGEGIRPAVESGLMAAHAIAQAAGRYTRDRFEPYAQELQRRFGRTRGVFDSIPFPTRLRSALLPWMFQRSWFARHLLLERLFLRAGDAPLVLPTAGTTTATLT